MRYGCEFKPARIDCRFPDCTCDRMSEGGAVTCEEPDEEFNPANVGVGIAACVPRLPPERLCE